MRVLPHNRLHVHTVPIALLAVFIIGIAAAAISVAIYPSNQRVGRLGKALTGHLFAIDSQHYTAAKFSFDEPAAALASEGIPGFDSLGDTSRHTFLIHSAAAETAAKAAEAQANQQLLNSKTGKAIRSSFR